MPAKRRTINHPVVKSPYSILTNPFCCVSANCLSAKNIIYLPGLPPFRWRYGAIQL